VIFDRTHSFEKSYKKLPDEVRTLFLEKMELMEKHFDHPSLRIKKVHQVKHVYEGSVNMHYRFTFQLIPGGILLRHIGKHDITLAQP
jgi:mRNA-degrading endonuclease RelE of RelBE toxin-antitoxin system